MKFDRISIPLRYNLEAANLTLAGAIRADFNSTKVQFGELFSAVIAMMNLISIPLRYNLEY